MASVSASHRHLVSASLGTLLMGCSALVALPSALAAQESADETGNAFRLSPIIVDAGVRIDDDAGSIVATELWTGGKVATSILDTPASVSVVTEKEIEARGADTVEDVLEYTSGIVSDYYGTDDRNDYYLVRGFQASTYRDGLNLGTMRGVREEPYAYERLEVVKGGNSTLFGTSDPGGTLNFVTKSPRFERFGELYGSYGTHEQAEIGFDFGDVIDPGETLAYRLVGKVKDGEREYDYSRDDEQFFLGALTWAPTAYTELTFTADYLKRDTTPNSGGYPLDREYDRDEFFGEPDFNDQDVERTTLSAAFRHEFEGGLKLRANLRYSDLDDGFGYVYVNDNAGRVGSLVDRYYFAGDSSSEEWIGNAIVQYDTSFGSIDSSTLAGVEFRDASNSSSSAYDPYTQIDVEDPSYSGAPTGYELKSDQETDYFTRSVFAQQNLSFSDRVVVTAGIRRDWLEIEKTDRSSGAAVETDGDFAETSYRAALTYKVSDEVSAYASYVESVAPPSIGSEPERGEQYEIGVKYQPAGVNALFTASIYDLTKNNVVVPVVLDNGVIERQTIGESNVRGFELEAKGELASNLGFAASYAYQESEFVRGAVRGVDVSGNEFATVPNHIASAWLTYAIPGEGMRGDLELGLGARYVGEYEYNAYNTGGTSPEQTYLDASLAYDFSEDTALQINVSNLLDEQYVVGRGTADYYNNGRTVTATLRRTW
ncbi:TonB-dependent siderophore receptor [Roseicyclus sp. F158]|uniref:TonB-dependent siderophore receptor n=1 Tax=Tropicimonas omnivorans TaxID=3075590 RepID=A0ABU3DL83_9RHOB|nr:TonB-dependent siderophore receptor [Roseicyclus sp. F158]MDT0684469.1 TonB-dependent siderophore receptor [Roseicyclus sp. F158]